MAEQPVQRNNATCIMNMRNNATCMRIDTNFKGSDLSRPSIYYVFYVRTVELTTQKLKEWIKFYFVIILVSLRKSFMQLGLQEKKSEQKVHQRNAMVLRCSNNVLESCIQTVSLQ